MPLLTVFERNDTFWPFTPHDTLISSVSYLSCLRMLSGFSPRITRVNPGRKLSHTDRFPAVKAHGSLGKSVLLFCYFNPYFVSDSPRYCSLKQVLTYVETQQLVH